MKDLVQNILFSVKPDTKNALFSKGNLLNLQNVDSYNQFNNLLKKAENQYHKAEYGSSYFQINQPRQQVIQQTDQYSTPDVNSNNTNDSHQVKNDRPINKPQESQVENSSTPPHSINNTDTKIDEIVDKIREKITKIKEKSDKTKEKKVNDPENMDWKELLALLNKLFDQSVSDDKKISLSENVNIEKGLKSLKKLINNMSKDNSELMNQLKAFLNKWEELLDKIKIDPNNNSLAKDKSTLKNLLSEIQSLLDKNENQDKNNILIKSDKLQVQNPINQNQKAIESRQNEKSNSTQDSISKNTSDLNTTDKKSDIKIQNLNDSSNSQKLDMGDSSNKLANISRNFSLPRGLNIKNPGDLFDQIVNKANIVLTNKRNEMNIQLEPKFLGQMHIKIMVENGIVSGRFIVENQLVKTFLEQNMDLLKENLQANGLSFDKMDIFYGETPKDSQPHRENSRNNIFQPQNNFINNPVSASEEGILNQYMTPDWLAKQVNVVI